MPSHLDPTDADLLNRVPVAALAGHGVPDPGLAARRERAAEAIASMVDGTLRVSPLGPGWSSDVDVHMDTLPDPQALREAGWRPLAGLLRRVGSSGPGRWAVLQDGRWVTGADLTTAPEPDPVRAVGERARRRGEVRLREVLELRVLRRQGAALDRAGEEVLACAAALERAAGGSDLSAFDGGTVSASAARPVALGVPVGARARRLAATTRRAVFGPRIVVGLSGVDGSGKSSLAKEVTDQLAAAGVPSSLVWARPGMRIGVLQAVAWLGRGILRQGSEPGVRSVASGTSTPLPSRKGVVGWAWALLVAVSFAVDVRKRHGRARGVVVYDRHLIDALVTMDFVYAGVDLRLARWICRRALPRADLSFYVDVPAEVAVGRKPNDTFGHHAITEQLEGYRRWLDTVPGITLLDGTQPIDDLATIVLDRLVARDRR